VFDEFKHFIAVAPLIVVPTDKFHERISERDSGFGVEYRSERAADKVRVPPPIFRFTLFAFGFILRLL